MLRGSILTITIGVMNTDLLLLIVLKTAMNHQVFDLTRYRDWATYQTSIDSHPCHMVDSKMGSYNKIHVQCPKCQVTNELQTKGGSCNFEKLTLQTASIGDLSSVVDEVHTCVSCGIKFVVHVVCLATTMVHVEIPEDEY